MEDARYRKLMIDLPREPVYDQRPWLWAGIAFAVAILIMIGGSYIQYKKQKDMRENYQTPGPPQRMP